jgi:hypothetical protein
MKKVLSKLAFLAGLAAAVSQASAVTLTVGDGRYLGLIDDGIPSDLSDTAGFINILLARPLGSGPTTVGTETYTRSNVASPAGAAELTGAVKQDNNGTSINVTNFEYLAVKYDAGNAGTLVWYVGDLSGVHSFQQFFTGTQWEVSHSALFNASTGNLTVPDTGSTLALLGLGTVLLAMADRPFFQQEKTGGECLRFFCARIRPHSGGAFAILSLSPHLL